MESIDKGTMLKSAIDLYWGGFTYHANQRISSLRYFVGVFGLIAASLRVFPSDNVETRDLELVSTVISLFGWGVSILFMRLDFRNQQLVDAYENPVRLLQASIGSVMAKYSSVEQSKFEAIDETDRVQQQLMTHGAIISMMYFICAFISLVAAAYYAKLGPLYTEVVFLILFLLTLLACRRDRSKEIQSIKGFDYLNFSGNDA